MRCIPAQLGIGDARLMEALSEGSSLDLSQSVKLVMEKIHAWRGASANRDDASVLALEFSR